MTTHRLPPHDWSATSDHGVVGVDGDGVRVRPRALSPEAGPWFGTMTEFVWNIPRRERRTVTVLPYPVPHIVHLDSRLLLCGVPHHRVVHELRGSGTGFAIALRPGGLARLFAQRDASALADRAVPLSRWLGTPRARQLADALHHAVSPDAKAAAVHCHLRPEPYHGTELARARDVIEAVLDHDRFPRVQDAADHHALSIRSLQRLFNVHVGAGPKAATQRCRLVRAAAELVREPRNWTRVVTRFGYFDQPHFINDFGRALGITPAAFAAQCRSTPRPSLPGSAPPPEVRIAAYVC